jgi:hypothetical protein
MNQPNQLSSYKRLLYKIRHFGSPLEKFGLSIFYSLLALMLLGLTVTVIYAFANAVIAERLRPKIVAISGQWKVPISVEHIGFRGRTVVLGDIVVGREEPIVIDQIKVSLDFRFWTKRFFRPSSIEIGQVFVKNRVSRNQVPPWLKQQVEIWRSRLAQAGQERGQQNASGQRAPKPTLSVKSLHVVFQDERGIHTEINNLQLFVDVTSKMLKGYAGQVTYLNKDIFENVDFSLSGTTSGEDGQEFNVKLTDAAGWLRVKRWSMTCSLLVSKKSIKEGQCDGLGKEFPVSWTKPLVPYLTSKLGGKFSVQLKRAYDVGPAEQLHLEAKGQLSNLVVLHPSISSDQVGPFGLHFNTKVALDQMHKVMNIEELGLEFSNKRSKDLSESSGLKMLLHGKINWSSPVDLKTWNADVSIKLPPSACSTALASLPRGFADDIGGFGLDGQLSALARFTYVSGSPSVFVQSFDHSCTVVSTPSLYSRAYLNEPFILERQVSESEKIRIPVDPNQSGFTSLKDVSSVLSQAIITSEDAGFWQHQGYEPGALRQAFERNAREGRVVVGGSTITMQTVKNLFLSRDKTISRKAQEIFLAWHLEHVIDKKRILEIYLNIVELGPRLFGVGAASDRFFGKKPKELSLLESVYIASLLPAPIPRVQYYCRQAVTPNYQRLLLVLLERLYNLNRISLQDFESAKDSQLQFRSSVGDPICQKIVPEVSDETETDLDVESSVSD